MRTFLAFRGEANIANIRAIREVVRAKLAAIREAGDLYTFEQADVSRVVDKTRSGAERQREQTAQVNTAITGMSASVQDVAASANLAAESAQNADESVKSGQAVVDITVSSINDLAVEIETGVDVISKLSDEAGAIGAVLDVIKGVAEQTNLLALNAAIEAARAGEQGRGFAVVADEVRTLASRNQDSTREIEAMIEKLQVEARAAVDTIGQGQIKARASVDSASNAGDALREISAAVATISSMNLQIASAAEQQSSVTVEIRENVVSINDVADENADGSQKLADSSRSLANIADELQQLVAHFKY